MHHLWVDDYAAFKAYILTELGERPTPKHSLDRVNNDGHYEPGNLTWATKRDQSLNRRTSVSEPYVYFHRGGWEVHSGLMTKEQAIAYRDAGEREIRSQHG